MTPQLLRRRRKVDVDVSGMTPLQLCDEGYITFAEALEVVGQQWVTTYHLTAAHNVDSILRNGLRPYRLDKWGFPEEGIWLWAERPTGKNLHWTVIQRMIDHETDEVALLSVRTRLSWTWLTVNDCAWLGFGNDLGIVGHHGSMTGNKGNCFIYHENCPARIGLQAIPPHYIRVVDAYGIRGASA